MKFNAGDAKEQTQVFAKTLLPEKVPDGHAALIWTLPDRKSKFVADAMGIVKAAHAANKANKDVYIGTCLRDMAKVRLDKGERGDSASCSYALAVGLDLDVGIDPKGKKIRFKTTEQALECLGKHFPLTPSMLILSGGANNDSGVHGYWNYKEPLSLELDKDRRLAEGISRAWNRKLAIAAKEEYGVDVDSVFDLSRVLRVPGTMNRKMQYDPKPVAFFELNERKAYNTDDHIDMLGMEAIEDATDYWTLTVEKGMLRYDPNAEPPEDKFRILLANVEKFGVFWRRSALLYTYLKDRSASAIDMALANLAVQAEWSDQEITNLLIASRRKHGDELKLRDSYYATTIGKARMGYDGTAGTARSIDARTRVAEEREARKAERDSDPVMVERRRKAERLKVEAAKVADILDVVKVPDVDERRALTLAQLKEAFGLDIARVVSNGRDPVAWRVVLTNGEVHYVERTDYLLFIMTWQRIALDAQVRNMPVEPTRKVWGAMKAAISSILEIEPDKDGLADYLAEYLIDAVAVDENLSSGQRAEMILSGRQIRLADGRPGVHLSSLLKWLWGVGWRTDGAALKSRLAGGGWVATTISYRVEGQGSSRTYWIGPSPDALRDPLPSDPGEGRPVVPSEGSGAAEGDYGRSGRERKPGEDDEAN